MSYTVTVNEYVVDCVYLLDKIYFVLIDNNTFDPVYICLCIYNRMILRQVSTI